MFAAVNGSTIGSVNATVSSRILGRRLRAMRTSAGLTVRGVAQELQCSPSTLSSIEGGYRPIRPGDLSHLCLIVYGSGDTGRDMATLATMEGYRERAEHGRDWWHECADEMPLHLQAYLDTEGVADTHYTCSINVLPGLFQEPEYIREQARSAGDTDTENIERRVWIRSQRRERLYSSNRPLRVDAIIDEGALRRCAASGLYDQIHALINLSELPHVTIRVLAEASGVHDVTGSYVILTLPDRVLPPIMYLEYVGGSILVEDESSVALAMGRHQSLLALDSVSSRYLMQDIIKTDRE